MLFDDVAVSVYPPQKMRGARTFRLFQRLPAPVLRRSLCSFTVAAALGLYSPFSPGQTQPSVESFLRSGTEAMQKGDAAAAESAFRNAVRIEPNNPVAHLDLGLALIREGDARGAATEIQNALTMDSRLPGAAMFLGIAQFQSGNYDEASTALEKAVAEQPDSAEAQMWLGLVELTRNRPEAAIAPLDRAAELAPNNLDILDYRGRAHSLVSLHSYQAMYKIDPDSWHVHRALAQSYADQGQPKKAIDEYLAAISRNPHNSDLYESLGDVYRRVSQFDLAKKAYEQELQISPNNPVALFDLGSILIDQDDAKAGLTMVQRASEGLPKEAAVYFYQGLAEAKLGQNKQAAEQLALAAGADPARDLAKRVYYEQSRILRKLGRSEDSEAALKKFEALQNASAEGSTVPFP